MEGISHISEAEGELLRLEGEMGMTRGQILALARNHELPETPLAERWKDVYVAYTENRPHGSDPELLEMYAQNIDCLEVALEGARTLSDRLEAGMRRCLVHCQKPVEAPSPSWLIPALAAMLPDLTPGVGHSAAQLIRAFLHVQEGIMPTLEGGPRGTLEVTWAPNLSWLVYPSTLPWPACDVRVYGDFRDTPRSFRLASSVIRESLRILQTD